MATADTAASAHNFFLTPQQQELLFAALNSNNPQGLPNNAFTTSPPAPQQVNSNGPLHESPFEYEDNSFADSGYDFSFQSADGSRMIGDMPGRSPTTGSDGSQGDHEKRGHPDDEDEEAADPKRRESGDKVPKKPGRKPLTTEPTSKRKAQNRAAQRAFRERKENHLKELETKIHDLEQATKSTKSENDKLRSQLEKTNMELDQYKKKLTLMSNERQNTGNRFGTFGSAMMNNFSDVNFQFEFPKFGTMGPGSQPTPMYGGYQVNGLSHSTSQTQSPASIRTPSQDAISPPDATRSVASMSSTYTSALDQQTKDDIAKFSRVLTPQLTSGNVASASRGSMDSYYSTGPASTASPSDSASKGPSSSCGTSPEPTTQSPSAFNPVDTMATIGEETQPSLAVTNGNFGNLSNGLTDFDFLNTKTTNFQFDPELFGDYRDASNNWDDTLFGDTSGAIDFTTPFNMAPSPLAQPKEKVIPTKDLVATIDAIKDAGDEGREVTTETMVAKVGEGELLTCTKIWEKLQDCPKVQSGDFDLDGLCADLQSKAKCSGNGPVVAEAEFRTVVKKWLCPNATQEMLEKGPKVQPPIVI